MSESPWPKGFTRVPNDPWCHAPIGELARKYDTVENHEWYDNLEPTLEQLHSHTTDNSLVLDYSGGTGILIERYFAESPQAQTRFVLVDASPQFLRLAYEKRRDDPRVAFRWLRYLRNEKRLQKLEEVLDPMPTHHFDVVCSTNAIHLYYQLPQTLASWHHYLKPQGVVLVQSGNVRNPAADSTWWIIDETVEQLQPIAKSLAVSEDRYTPFADQARDEERMAQYDKLRAKYFLPVRPLSYYQEALNEAGLEVTDIQCQPIHARTQSWYEFLSAYHEGVLGWAGGAEKIEGHAPAAQTVQLRQELLRASLEQLLGGEDFTAAWTYITCRAKTL